LLLHWSEPGSGVQSCQQHCDLDGINTSLGDGWWSGSGGRSWKRAWQTVFLRLEKVLLQGIQNSRQTGLWRSVAFLYKAQTNIGAIDESIPDWSCGAHRAIAEIASHGSLAGSMPIKVRIRRLIGPIELITTGIDLVALLALLDFHKSAHLGAS
jgi:hypothetical protein